MSKHVKIESTNEAWESGALGTSEDHVRAAPAELEAAIDGLLWLCAKHGGTFKPVADCAAVNPPLSWKNALAADKKEPT